MKPRSSYGFESLLSGDAWREWMETVERGRRVLDGRTIWNVNTTASGGGVAEMLWSLVAYARGVGIDTRWLVMEGDERFFRLTKRIHNMLHGANGDGLGLGAEDHRVYEEVSRVNADDLLARTRPGDIVLLHDPQTAGMTPLVRADRFTVWRSHIGMDALNEQAHRGWAFLADYIEPAHRYVFTRRQYAPPGLDPGRIVVIPPSIDAFSPKNQQLAPDTVRAILATAGLVSGWGAETAVPGFVRTDGTIGIVSRRAALSGPPPPATAPLVLEVSRWDRLKDPVGMIRGFVEHTAARVPEAHVMYAGPAAAAVADDPEGGETMRETRAAWVRTAGPCARPSALGRPAHGRPGRERRDRQCAAAPRYGRGAEVPGRRLRAHCRRGYVEAPASRGQLRGRHPGPDRVTGVSGILLR